jgi:hypothetical protein
MKFVLHPWQLLLLILAGWINHQEQEVIEYLRAENRVLREKLGKKRILLNDDQRRQLAVKGKILGRKMLEPVVTIVTPDAILRWHRELVAAKWDYSGRRKKIGRPAISAEVAELVLRMARENPSWGFDRIQGALANLGHLISDISVGNILKAHGVDPAPDRKRCGIDQKRSQTAGEQTNDWVYSPMLLHIRPHMLRREPSFLNNTMLSRAIFRAGSRWASLSFSENGICTFEYLSQTNSKTQSC